MSAGLAFMTGPRGQPLRAGASIVDVGAAAYGVIAVLAALHQRAQTGRGQKITSGLFETVVFWVGQWLAQHAATGQPSVPMPEIRQGTRMGWGVYQLFSAADGEQIFIGITSNGHWERFCDEFGLKDLLADERLDDNAKRVAARDWLPARIAEEMHRHPSAELSERLERARVPFAPLRRPDQLLDDAHLLASGQLLDTPLPGGGIAKLPKLPVRSTAFDMGLQRPAPTLGEHTREVLRELGLDTDRSTHSRHGGSSDERHAEPRHDQGSGPARGLPVREGGHRPRRQDLPGGRALRHPRLHHRVHVLRQPQVGAPDGRRRADGGGLKRVPGVAYEAIWLNEAGLERAARLRESLALRPMFGVAAQTPSRARTPIAAGREDRRAAGLGPALPGLGRDWIDVG